MRPAAAGLLAAILASSSLGAEESPRTEALIRLADEVAKEVETLRGWKFRDPVAKAVYSEDQLRSYLEKRIAVEYPEDELQRIETMLRMLGALPDSTSLVKTTTEILLSQIGGLYDPETRALYMIDREGQEFGPFVERVLIAHELAHALDDQVVGLDSLMKARERTQDAEFVTGALVEGSATALMARYVTASQQSGEMNPQELMSVMESEEERGRAFFEAPAYFHTLLANYACGMSFLLRGDLSALLGGRDDVGANFLAAVHDPPKSGEQILHPEKYWDADQRDGPVRVEDADVEPFLERIGRVVHRDVMGELLIGVLTGDPSRATNPLMAGLPNYWTTAAARGWGGDRFYLLERATAPGKPAGVWFTLWDSPQDRDEFDRAYTPPGNGPGESLLLGSQGKVLFLGLTAEEIRALREAWVSRPPRFWKGLPASQGVEAWTP